MMEDEGCEIDKMEGLGGVDTQVTLTFKLCTLVPPYPRTELVYEWNWGIGELGIARVSGHGAWMSVDEHG